MYIPKGGDWDTYQIRVNHPKTKALKLLLKLNETKKYPGMSVNLDRFQLKMGNTGINSLPIESLEKPYFFDPAYKIVLEDSLSYANIPDLKGKKLIGIGECTHGSQEIKETAYELIKYLIVKEGVKYVFLETPRSIGLHFDLYVQGLIPEDKKEDIFGMMKSTLDNYEETFQFLHFVRTYNQSTKDKVNIFGIDN